MTRSALVPAALVLALAGSTAAFAGESTSHRTDYTMKLSSASAAVPAGETTTTVVSFRARPYLRGTRVSLSVSDLPGGVTATFRPPTPLINGSSVLTFTTASSTPVSISAITVTAITISSDPIGTSATFGLTVTGP
jgi:hypothetical protein